MPKSHKEAVEVNAAISSLITGDREGKYVLPSSVRIGLAGILRRTRGPTEDFNDERANLIRKYGVVKEGQGGKKDYEVPVDAPNRAEFDKEFKAMASKPTELETFGRVDKSELFGETTDKDGKKTCNRIDVEVLSVLLAAGIIDE